MREIRCENGILFGYLLDDCFEVKCRSNRCGAGPGVIILHRFDARTGKFMKTLRLADPRAPKQLKEG